MKEWSLIKLSVLRYNVDSKMVKVMNFEVFTQDKLKHVHILNKYEDIEFSAHDAFLQ